MDNKKLLSSFMMAALMMQLSGCSDVKKVPDNSSEDSAETVLTEHTESNEQNQLTELSDKSEADSSDEDNEDGSVKYSDRELTYEWDKNCTVIEARESGFSVNGEGADADGNVLTLSSAGTYYISGSISNGKIVVDSKDKKAVRLIMGGLDIGCSDDVPVNVIDADKLIITLEDGKENHISGTAAEGDDLPSGVVFSKSDLTFNGNGSLAVEAKNGDGIVSKDKLKIVSGNITVEADDDGIVGRDLFAMRDGSVKIISGDDGIKSTNSEDAEKGNIVIEGGTISITAGDDGIHSENSLTFDGGDITVLESYEGLEASLITVNSGNIHVCSSDDGINISSDDRQAELMLRINGGTVYVDAGGDGLDSNGDIEINGGLTLVNGPTANNNGPLDCGDNSNEIVMNGGVLIAAGSNGMFEVPSESSAQNVVASSMLGAEAGTLCTLADEQGNVIAAFRPVKKAAAIVISTPEIKTGESYVLYTGGTYSENLNDNGYASGGTVSDSTEVTTFEVASAVTVHGNVMSGRPGGFGGGRHDFQNGEMPEGGFGMHKRPDGEMPEGDFPGFKDGEMPEGDFPGFKDGEMPEGDFPGFKDGEMSEGGFPGFKDGEMPERPDGEFRGHKRFSDDMNNENDNNANDSSL